MMRSLLPIGASHASPRRLAGRGGFLLAGLLLALALLGAAAPAPAAAPAAPSAAAAPTTAAAPFLWEVRGRGATHYLLGSVHLLPQAAHPLPKALEDAYARADTLVFESDLGALDAPEMQKDLLAAARVDGGLAGEIPKALYERVQARARAYGLSASVCDPYAAWFCALTFDVFSFHEQGFDAALGLDQTFYQRAVDDNKTVEWFEAPREHLRLFSGMGAQMGREFLAATLDEADDPAEQPEALLKAWQSGDVAFVETLVVEMRRDFPDLYERLLAARNRAWLPGLAARLEGSAPQLVVVGAAHLVGADGLLAALRARGFEVRAYGAPAATEPADAPLPRRGP
ncbi:TraB/GumN family protein [Solimonas flava]|uniref:TraB/GumN family protein n=1 Tax=Solimonas flava TaxID=415849 RepID=UPI000416A849|nr:TraB/GumN family protein [Solimonas flava]